MGAAGTGRGRRRPGPVGLGSSVSGMPREMAAAAGGRRLNRAVASASLVKVESEE